MYCGSPLEEMEPNVRLEQAVIYSVDDDDDLFL
jgi:hypothetical protein